VIRKWLRRLFPRSAEPWRPGYAFALGGGWGNAINWQDWERRRVVGWKQRHPKMGDRLDAEMQSGRVAVFRFTNVEPCLDPRDMFFASVEDMGYADDFPLPPVEKRSLFLT